MIDITRLFDRIPTPSDRRETIDRLCRLNGEIEIAWPSIPTIRLDPCFAGPRYEHHSPAHLLALYYPGTTNSQDRPRQIIITDSTDRLRQERERFQPLPRPEWIKTSTSTLQAAIRTVETLSSDDVNERRQNATKVAALLLPFGIEPDQTRMKPREGESVRECKIRLTAERLMRPSFRRPLPGEPLTGQNTPMNRLEALAMQIQLEVFLHLLGQGSGRVLMDLWTPSSRAA
ncbi:hypothetical protein U5801_11840 [Lamprobacter modestohalophilus]|uniref:hypothetical protein n=1 Tax=Lamprobacter modestohalophilus TaxID=1064514 RepID=UPI002ADEEF8B|nr:hypothetical protein [Lamprobacter modestohalophilus]MEA1050496.1 hypothetical protein [Lamprobacter modestohalophilus]